MAYDQQLADALREIGVLKRGWETAFNIGVSEQEQNKKLRAENERLRAALNDVMQWWDGLPSKLRQDIEGSGAVPGCIARVRALRQSGNKEASDG